MHWVVSKPKLLTLNVGLKALLSKEQKAWGLMFLVLLEAQKMPE